MDKKEAVKEINRTCTTAYVKNACERALKDGSDKALTKALVETHNHSTTLYAKTIAGRQLGFE